MFLFRCFQSHLLQMCCMWKWIKYILYGFFLSIHASDLVDCFDSSRLSLVCRLSICLSVTFSLNGLSSIWHAEHVSLQTFLLCSTCDDPLVGVVEEHHSALCAEGRGLNPDLVIPKTCRSVMAFPP